MKKLLAIILAVAMVMSMAVAVSADAPEGYEVGQLTKANFGSSGWDSTYADGVITYDGAWTGRGWWIGSDNPMTGYDSMIIEFPGAEIPAQVVVNYTDGRDSSPSFAINAGATKVTVDLEHEVGISQIYIQCKEAGTLTLGDVYMRTYVEPAPDYPDPINLGAYTGGEAAINLPAHVEDGTVFTLILKGTVAFADGATSGSVKIYPYATGNWSTTAVENAEKNWNLPATTLASETVDMAIEFTISGNGSGADLIRFTSPSGLDAATLAVSLFEGTKADYENSLLVGDDEEEETYRGSGYFMTGDETHAMIIGKAIITSNHEFDEDGDCKYCGHHVDVEVEDIIVEQPTESTEEESEDITVEEPKEDTNPGTGLTLAVIPAIVALAAVVISKR